MMVVAAQKAFWLNDLLVNLEYKREKFVSFSLRSNSPREDTSVESWRADFQEVKALSSFMKAGTISKMNHQFMILALVYGAKNPPYQQIPGFYQELVGRFFPSVDFSVFCPHRHLSVEETGVDSCRATTYRMDGFRCYQSWLEDTSQGSFSRFLGVPGNTAAILVNAAFPWSMLIFGCRHPS